MKTISRPIGAWTADWKDLAHNLEVRWPYVFVSGYEDGLQVFNMMDPTNPYTVGYYYTCHCAHDSGWAGNRQAPRAQRCSTARSAIDVRNADGLIVISDRQTGFWASRWTGSTAGTGTSGACRIFRARRIGIMGLRGRSRAALVRS